MAGENPNELGWLRKIYNQLARTESETSRGFATDTFRILSSPATTNASLVKNAPGTIYRIAGYNANAAPRYLKLYNLAVAPIVGTSVPVRTIYLPGTAAFFADLAFGRYFSTGIALAITTGLADNDTGALTLADIVALNLDYS